MVPDFDTRTTYDLLHCFYWYILNKDLSDYFAKSVLCFIFYQNNFWYPPLPTMHIWKQIY